MRRLLLILTLCTAILPPLAAEAARPEPRPRTRPKVGLVLCGGGAKGTAHIGVLKVLEKAGIPIDYIAGTSMGSIIGGLYSIGYTANQLDSIVRKIDWSFLLSDKKRLQAQDTQERNKAEKYLISRSFGKDPKDEVLGGGLIRGHNIQNTFSALTIGYHDSIDFSQLPIPFACVAQDIVTGKEVVLKSGVLATAMRASMAVPGVFSPIRENGMVLIDGGMVNNYPVDVVRAMGADIVIGVDVQNNLKNDSTLRNAGDILGQIISLMGVEKYDANVRQTDVHIQVDVEGFGATSFTTSAIDSLIRNGREAAEKEWIALRAISLREQSFAGPAGLQDSTGLLSILPQRPYRSFSPERKVAIARIVIPDMSPKEEAWLMKRCGLQENNYTTVRQIEQAMDLLCSHYNYEWVSFRLSRQADGFYTLYFMPEQKQMVDINLGARFDNEELASILLNLTANLKGKRPSVLSLTARLGKRSVGEIGYSRKMSRRGILESSLLYRFSYNDINVHREGKRYYNATYRQHTMEAFFSTSDYHGLRFVAGLRCEFLNYSNFLSNIKSEYSDISQAENERLISYFADLHMNSWDDAYFPTLGLQMLTSYALITDNFAKYRGGRPFFTLQSSWEAALSLSPRFCLLPSVHARLIRGDNSIPYSQQNTLGCDSRGRFLPQQLPFYGICNLELADDMLSITGIKARYLLGTVHYFSLGASIAMNSPSLAHYWDGRCLYGFSLKYSLRTPFGPASLSSEYSNHTKKVAFSLNLGFYF